jgi:hypothetical protein
MTKSAKRHADVNRHGRWTPVSENVAYDLGFGAVVDLSTGVAVSQNVCAQHLDLNAGQPCILADPMSNGSARQRRMWHCYTDENLAGDSVGWSR